MRIRRKQCIFFRINESRHPLARGLRYEETCLAGNSQEVASRVVESSRSIVLEGRGIRICVIGIAAKADLSRMNGREADHCGPDQYLNPLAVKADKPPHER